MSTIATHSVSQRLSGDRPDPVQSAGGGGRLSTVTNSDNRQTMSDSPIHSDSSHKTVRQQSGNVRRQSDTDTDTNRQRSYNCQIAVRKCQTAVRHRHRHKQTAVIQLSDSSQEMSDSSQTQTAVTQLSDDSQEMSNGSQTQTADRHRQQAVQRREGAEYF